MLRFIAAVAAAILLPAGAAGQTRGTIDFYHGTDYDAAVWILKNRLSPQTLSSFSQPSVQGREWRAYTDFGKGFYTHVPGNYSLAKEWAILAALEKCKDGRTESAWGVVTFHVPPQLVRPFDVTNKTRVLYFGGKDRTAWNAPGSRARPGTRMTWREFIAVNRHLIGISSGVSPQREGDYDWSQSYAWIQGPIWVPSEHGLPGGGEQFPERIHQRNWLSEGINDVLNNRNARRTLSSGVVSCDRESSSSGATQYGVFLAKNDILVGNRNELGQIPLCRLRGFGIDCKKRLGESINLVQLAGPFPTKDAATRWMCAQIIPGTTYRPPLARFLHGAKMRFDGKTHLLTNAPGCGR